jgi:hypothetical protein
MLSVVEFLVWASYDEMRGPRLAWQSMSAAVLVAGVLGCMRATRRAGRVAALLGSALLSVGLGMGAGAYYWQGAHASGYAIDQGSLLAWALWFVVPMVPSLVSAVLNLFLPASAAGQ